MGSPPFVTLKKFVLKKRSNISSNRPTEMGGMAVISRNATTSVIQTNTGIRSSVMPGARMLRMVTMKLNAEASEAMPSICRPTAQKSTPWPGV